MGKCKCGKCYKCYTVCKSKKKCPYPCYKSCCNPCYDPCKPYNCGPAYCHKVQSLECQKLRAIRSNVSLVNNGNTSVTVTTSAGSGITFSEVSNNGAGLFRIRGTFTCNYTSNPTIQLTPEYPNSGAYVGPNVNLNSNSVTNFEFSVDLSTDTTAVVHVTAIGGINCY